MKCKHLIQLSVSLSTLALITTMPIEGQIFAEANQQHKHMLAQNSAEETRIRLYEQATPAVVLIQTNRSSGSGFIVSADGLIITNAHVVQNAASPVIIVLANEQKLQADVVAFAENGLDLAALQIRGGNNLPTLPLASLGSVRVGQSVYAIGSPFGAEYQNSFTAGIVSRFDSRRGLIQHDAAINQGNSGGPLLNSQGEVIGVNSEIRTPEVRNNQGAIGRSIGNIGISFAIAVDRLQPFLVALGQGNAPRASRRQQPESNNNTVQALPLTGQAMSGRLGTGDNLLPDNSYFKLYRLEGKAGQRVTIEMSSQEIDSTLFLLKPDGSKLEQNDDISPNNFNARIVVTLPESGVYTVMVNAFEPGESGSYTVRAMAQ